MLTFGNKFQFLVCKILYSTKDLPECNNRIRLPLRERMKYGVRWHFHYPPYWEDSSNKAGNRRNRAQSLIVIKDINERQNTRELEISLWARGHDFALVRVYNSLY